MKLIKVDHLVDYALEGGLDIPPQDLLIGNGFPLVPNNTIVQCSNYDYTRPPCDRKSMTKQLVK
jgi:hypothetical protein